jgi:hypothetical protein
MSGGLCLRHKSSGLVLDATNNRVTLKPYNGSSSQLWESQNTTIRSAQNGEVSNHSYTIIQFNFYTNQPLNCYF